MSASSLMMVGYKTSLNLQSKYEAYQELLWFWYIFVWIEYQDVLVWSFIVDGLLNPQFGKFSGAGQDIYV